MMWYTDGAGWNGRLSRWAVVNNNGFQRVFEEVKPYTNNQTEYFAMQAAIGLAKNGDEIYSDSELIVYQLSGTYKVRDEKLRPLYQACIDSMKQKPRLSVRVIKRESNKAGHLLEGWLD